MKLTRKDLLSLEQYAEERDAFRARVIEHKKNRQVFLCPHASLHFEDATTMKYQVQEMLRIERIFTAAGIQEELDAYNPLIPDGSNWKATFMIEYADVAEREVALRQLAGIEDTVWVGAGDTEKVYAIANEDLERTREDKTAAVHFLRFELSSTQIQTLRNGGPLTMGIDHPQLSCTVTVPANVRASLLADFAPSLIGL